MTTSPPPPPDDPGHDPDTPDPVTPDPDTPDPSTPDASTPDPGRIFADAPPGSVREAGTVTVRSGRLSVADPNLLEAAAPLTRAVPDGEHRVQVRLHDGLVAGVRVVLADGAVDRWVEALTSAGRGQVGVDGGAVLLIDPQTHAEATTQQAEDLLDRIARSHDDTLPADLGGPVVGVVVSSGAGDGAYPMTWGLDADDGVVALVVDFLVLDDPALAAPDDGRLHGEITATLPCTPGASAHDVLRDHGVLVQVTDESRWLGLSRRRQVIVGDRHGRVAEVSVVDDQGRELTRADRADPLDELPVAYQLDGPAQEGLQLQIVLRP